MGILKDLYNGKIYPLEAIDPVDEEYRKTCERIGELRYYFEKKLPAEDKEKFEEWNQLLHNFAYMEDYANFAYGFRLGLVLMLEVLAGYKMPEE